MLSGMPFFYSFAVSLLMAAVACERSQERLQTAAASSVRFIGSPISRDELLGRFDPAAHPDFVRLEPSLAVRPNLYLRREAYEALIHMATAAQVEGVKLRVLSATRTFAQQKAIWERKWNERAPTLPDPTARAQSILEYSSMPGTSRHHWGTDVDLNALENSAFEAGGPHEKAYRWLTQNAHRFGFCQPYTPLGSERTDGYREEKWHWSYRPIAAVFLQQYAQQVTNSDLKGFTGDEVAVRLRVVERYVLGVDTSCR